MSAQLGDHEGEESAICHVCNRRFATQRLLSEHLRDAHGDEILAYPWEEAEQSPR
jgi:hypothetical protein